MKWTLTLFFPSSFLLSFSLLSVFYSWIPFHSRPLAVPIPCPFSHPFWISLMRILLSSSVHQRNPISLSECVFMFFICFHRIYRSQMLSSFTSFAYYSNIRVGSLKKKCQNRWRNLWTTTTQEQCEWKQQRKISRWFSMHKLSGCYSMCSLDVYLPCWVVLHGYGQMSLRSFCWSLSVVCLWRFSISLLLLLFPSLAWSDAVLNELDPMSFRFR